MANIHNHGRAPVGYIDESGMPMPMLASEFSDQFAKSVRWVYSQQELAEARAAFNAAQEKQRISRVQATYLEATRAAEEEQLARGQALKGFTPGHYNAAVFGGIPAVGAFAGLGGTSVADLSNINEQ